MQTGSNDVNRTSSAAMAQETSAAAMACIETIAGIAPALQGVSLSPLGMGRRIAEALAAGAMRRRVSVVRGDDGEREEPHGLVSAWPLRYLEPSRRGEKPLLYMLRTGSMARLSSAFRETAGRGVFLNTSDDTARWPNGLRPEIALWLAGYPSCIPYDPANAAEVGAIMQAALHALYVDGEQGYYYVNLHQAETAGACLGAGQLSEAATGMYFLERTGDAAADVILLGAGRALARVVRAARLLHAEWGIASEVWSCPSYTRLAREGRQLEQWNTLHPLAPRRVSRLEACLGGARPVVAVTDYGRHVAEQIGAYVAAPFLALGADPPDGAGRASAQRIALRALRLLADEGRVAWSCLEAALRKYGEGGA